MNHSTIRRGKQQIFKEYGMSQFFYQNKSNKNQIGKAVHKFNFFPFLILNRFKYCSRIQGYWLMAKYKVKFDFELFKMINSEKRAQERFCNCKQSRCMKLYCQCLSARVPCGKNCRCLDCHNTIQRKIYQQKFHPTDKRLSKQQLIRTHKGCACRRSNCTKKYCDCFQSGLLCKDTCKCVDCQNNESLTNRKIINQLRKNNSELSNNQSSINLYPLYISQNSDHLQSIITQSNPLNLHQNWLDECAKGLCEIGTVGNQASIFEKFLSILIELQQHLEQQLSMKDQCLSDQMINQQYQNENQDRNVERIEKDQSYEIKRESKDLDVQIQLKKEVDNINEHSGGQEHSIQNEKKLSQPEENEDVKPKGQNE